MIKEIDLYEDDLSEHDSNMSKHFIELVCFNCQLFQRLMLQLVYIIKNTHVELLYYAWAHVSSHDSSEVSIHMQY